MNWIKEDSSFTYNGVSVTRVKCIAKTPLGDFKVCQAVSGKVWMEYPYIGLDGNKKTQIKHGKMPCDTIENGLETCETYWGNLVAEINK